MRIAFCKAAVNCSGRFILSQYFETGLKQSFTEISLVYWFSNCCNTGSTERLAKISPGKHNTGKRVMVATGGAVIILVAPGPMEEVQANVLNLFFTLA